MPRPPVAWRRERCPVYANRIEILECRLRGGLAAALMALAGAAADFVVRRWRAKGDDDDMGLGGR